MALTPGSRLGVYEVTAQIGEGGMGQVWRGTDTTLGRQVAIKILPDAFAADPERLARFEREAKTLGSLNHPHIAAIYGFEKSSGMHALVMELVEGEDLSQRIARGAIPLDEALPIARQIAEALEAAHEQGIIHRDLKPANIKVRPDGTVKVLDFGLAKAVPQAPSPKSQADENLANSPTLSIHATKAGIILGTAAYMSPEQARGKAVDKRTDIWALGCVLFEMLTAKRAFPGDDATDTIISVVTKDPDWSALPPILPSGVRRLLRRSLEKDPKRRLDSAAAVRLEIDEASTAPQGDAIPGSPVSGAKRASQWLPWAVAAALAVALVISFTLVPRTAPATGFEQPPIHLLLSEQVPASTVGAERSFVIAPNGRRIVYLANTTGTPQLYLRDMGSVEATPIAGTQNAVSPFFSRDGQRIGFFASGKIQVLALVHRPISAL